MSNIVEPDNTPIYIALSVAAGFQFPSGLVWNPQNNTASLGTLSVSSTGQSAMFTPNGNAGSGQAGVVIGVSSPNLQNPLTINFDLANPVATSLGFNLSLTPPADFVNNPPVATPSIAPQS